MIKLSKKVAGKPITLTLSPYIFSQLEKWSKKNYLSKSAIATIAIERYAREQEKIFKEEASREK